jgi:hypothetical protein
MVGEFRVYLRAPGEVARCRQCGCVVMVFVEARGVTCVDLRGLAALDPARPVARRRVSVSPRGAWPARALLQPSAQPSARPRDARP